jgi:hypothetical protein
MVANGEGPGASSAGALDSDQLASRITSEFTEFPLAIQARFLAARYGVPAVRAVTVALLAYGEGAR